MTNLLELDLQKPPDPSKTAIEEWLESHFLLRSKPVKLRRRWKKVAEEVYARKTLIFAAKKTLDDRLKGAGERGADASERWTSINTLALAATDVFVEKAQRFLTDRANKFLLAGLSLALIAASLLVGASYWLTTKDVKTLLELDPTNGIVTRDNIFLVVLLVRATTMSALFVGAVAFLISLARSFLHEAVALYSRRHALRFGRLYVYFQGGDVDFQEMEDAFQWNKEFTTSFRDIHPEKVVKLPAASIVDLLKEVLRRADSPKS